MKKFWMILLAALLLAGCTNAGDEDTADVFPEVEITGEMESAVEDREIPHTNLAGLSVGAGFNQIGWNPMRADDRRSIGDNEVILFVNGSCADGESAVRVGRSTLVDVDAAAEAFGKTVEYDGETTVFDGRRADCIVMDGVRYLTVEDVCALFDCRAEVYDGGGMLPTTDLPHIFLSDLPGNGKTAEECRDYLQSGLIRAYENAFGAFVPYGEDEGEPEWDEFDKHYRRDITALPVTGENERFVLFEVPAFTRVFFVDRYTDDVFAYYPGYDCFFFPYDFDAPGALVFAG